MAEFNDRRARKQPLRGYILSNASGWQGVLCTTCHKQATAGGESLNVVQELRGGSTNDVNVCESCGKTVQKTRPEYS